MASVRVDEICSECLKANHCDGADPSCECCGLVVVPVKAKDKKPKRGEWK